MLTHSRDDDREILRTRRQPHTLRCAFFSLFRSPSFTLPPSFLHTPVRSKLLSLFLSLPLSSSSIVTGALLSPFNHPTNLSPGSGLMADGAIGFLQKRKRSSRKGAIDAVFVTRFVSLSLSLYLACSLIRTLSRSPVNTPLLRVNETYDDGQHIP